MKNFLLCWPKFFIFWWS